MGKNINKGMAKNMNNINMKNGEYWIWYGWRIAIQQGGL